MRKLLILRPEPGAGASAGRARALGLEPIVRPLFQIEALPWRAPDPNEFDALLLTSANALLHGGHGLADLMQLPAIAVGDATADAARRAGFSVSLVGDANVGRLLARLPPRQLLLHLCGEQHASASGGHDIQRVAVYRSAPIEDASLADIGDAVALVHSPRAGERLAALTLSRGRTAIAAISEAAADACGQGWESVDWPSEPTDRALLALAARLCQSPAR